MALQGRADGVLPLVLGLLLVLLGATGATLTQRRFELEGRSQHAPLWLVPFGILVGAGAALVRGWDLAGSMLIGAVLVPLVGAVGRLLEVRRRNRRGGRT
ncbi:hypothetical protein [Egicoccus sp. AB-alg6-2]|uniref:hypothetical protein n=1 Tax=Egicoccus sp. AB-alg6-2 TaxID=3242692 RepID=UPI00359E2B39